MEHRRLDCAYTAKKAMLRPRMSFRGTEQST